MSAQKKVGLLPALLVAVLAFGGFMGVAAVVSNNQTGLIPVSFADEGEDDEDEDKDEDKDEEEDKDDDKQKESEKKAKEAAKKKAERERESAKKAAENSEKSSDDDDENEGENGIEDDEDDMDDDGKENEDKDEDENELEDEDGDGNGMYKDRAKTMSKLEEEIAKAEKEILEKQAEGVDVTAALARLALAKTTAAAVGGAFDSNDLEAAKDLSKEVKKLAHFASEKDLHDAKEVAEDAAKVAKRITQAYGKVALLEAVGGDGSSFRSMLGTLEADLAALKATIASGSFDPETMSETLEALERRVKTVKSAAEGAIYALGGTDSKYDDEYEEESDDVFEHLNDVAEIEDDSVGRVIGNIAKEHRDSAKVVSNKVAAVDERNLILQTLFGPDRGDLRELEAEITSNKARADMLLRAAETIEDEDVKTILLDQVAVLREQTAKLETFVGGQRDRLSVFGWIFNLGK